MEERLKDADQRRRVVEAAIAQIERQFGKGAIMRLGEHPVLEVPVISTGSLSLDHALGIGGVPRGRIVEIFGPEASGKTTLALHIIAEAQRAGGTAAFIDAEHTIPLIVRTSTPPFPLRQSSSIRAGLKHIRPRSRFPR